MIQYLCVTAPALFAGLVQGVTGFGAGILLMMFYPFCFSMVQSSAMCQLLCAVLCISIVWRYRRFVRFRMCILPLVFYFPVYLAAMQAAARLDMDYLKPVLGIFLIALAVYFILGEGKIKISANPGTAFVCAALAGQLTGDMVLPLAAGAAALLLGAYAGSRVVDKIDIGKMKLLVYGFIGFAGVVTFVTGF